MDPEDDMVIDVKDAMNRHKKIAWKEVPLS